MSEQIGSVTGPVRHVHPDDFKRKLGLLLFPGQSRVSEAELLERVSALLKRERHSKALTDFAEAVFHAEHYHDAPQDVRLALDKAQSLLGL